MEPRLDPLRLDGLDIPSGGRVERRSQFFLTDGMRAGFGPRVAETQYIQCSIVFGNRRQTRYVRKSLVAVEGVE